MLHIVGTNFGDMRRLYEGDLKSYEELVVGGWSLVVGSW